MTTRIAALIAALIAVAVLALTACGGASAAPAPVAKTSDWHTSDIRGLLWACDGAVLIYNYGGHGSISALLADPRCAK